MKGNYTCCSSSSKNGSGSTKGSSVKGNCAFSGSSSNGSSIMSGSFTPCWISSTNGSGSTSRSSLVKESCTTSGRISINGSSYITKIGLSTSILLLMA